MTKQQQCQIPLLVGHAKQLEQQQKLQKHYQEELKPMKRSLTEKPDWDAKNPPTWSADKKKYTMVVRGQQDGRFLARKIVQQSNFDMSKPYIMTMQPWETINRKSATDVEKNTGYNIDGACGFLDEIRQAGGYGKVNFGNTAMTTQNFATDTINNDAIKFYQPSDDKLFIERAAQGLKDTTQGVKNAGNSALEGVKNTGSSVVQGIKSAGNSVVQSIQNAPENIKKGITNPGGSAISAGKSVVQGVSSAGSSALNAGKNAGKSALRGAYNVGKSAQDARHNVKEKMERAIGPARYNEVQLNTRHINPDKSIEFMAQMAIHEAHERVITKSAKGEIPAIDPNNQDAMAVAINQEARVALKEIKKQCDRLGDDEKKHHMFKSEKAYQKTLDSVKKILSTNISPQAKQALGNPNPNYAQLQGAHADTARVFFSDGKFQSDFGSTQKQLDAAKPGKLSKIPNQSQPE